MPLGRAILYALNQFEKLRRYLDDFCHLLTYLPLGDSTKIYLQYWISTNLTIVLLQFQGDHPQ